MENIVPDAMYILRPDRDGVDQYVNAEQVGPRGVTVEVGRYDRVTQRVDKCHLGISASGVALDPLALRYIAGLRLLARWGGWSGEPFDSRSVRHVSVYGR